MTATKRPWAAWEDTFLRQHYPDSLTADLATVLGRGLGGVYQRARRLGLAKTAEFVRDTARERIADPSHPGRTHFFQPGLVPPNKGLRRPGYSPGRMAESQFKPGRTPQEARNYVPIGSTRISRVGYLERKVTDDPALAPERRWVGVHRLVWEAAHGALQPGQVVAFKVGRRTTDEAAITPDALELVTRAELMRRNTIHRYGPEVAELMRLRARLAKTIDQAAAPAQDTAP